MNEDIFFQAVNEKKKKMSGEVSLKNVIFMKSYLGGFEKKTKASVVAFYVIIWRNIFHCFLRETNNFRL